MATKDSPTLKRDKAGRITSASVADLVELLAPRQPTPQPVAPPASSTPPMGNYGGGAIKKMASGGSASRRADGCAQRGKTKGTMV